MKILIKSFSAWLLVCGLNAPVALADPPPWAPAHGYRHKHHHKGDFDRDYQNERTHYYFGIPEGHCNREEIGTVLGGAVGGVVGGNTASDKTTGVIAGIIIGGVLGNVIGRSMDESDRYCTGHVLEYAEDHHTVSWSISNRDIRYHVTPVRTYTKDSRYCRDLVVVRETSRGKVNIHQTACRDHAGQWRMIK